MNPCFCLEPINQDKRAYFKARFSIEGIRLGSRGAVPTPKKYPFSNFVNLEILFSIILLICMEKNINQVLNSWLVKKIIKLQKYFHQQISHFLKILQWNCSRKRKRDNFFFIQQAYPASKWISDYRYRKTHNDLSYLCESVNVSLSSQSSKTLLYSLLQCMRRVFLRYEYACELQFCNAHQMVSVRVHNPPNSKYN